MTDPNDIDALMDKLVYTDDDIDQIIAYHRRQRGARSAGAAKSKAIAEGKVNLMDALGITAQTVAPDTFKRRV